MAFDVAMIRAQFPILQQQVNGCPLVYLDSAATSQKPQCVIDAVTNYYARDNANIHRSVHELAARATTAYDHARSQVATFLGTQGINPSPVDTRGCVFVRGATEGINLVANSWSALHLKPGDRVLITTMEHHANIVPWQLACERHGATLEAVPCLPDGTLDLDAFDEALSRAPKMVALTWVSNVLGTINPAVELVSRAKQAGATVLVDACQRAPHGPIDVMSLGADFMVFSGHKTFAPTGIGVLWARPEMLDALPPYQAGGDMIERVHLQSSTFAKAPMRFEAGTPNIAGAVGLGEALRWLSELDIQALKEHESTLRDAALDVLRGVEGMTLLGDAQDRVPVLAFSIKGVPPYDLAHALDRYGVAIRTGHHCAQPLHDALGISASARASFSLYNTLDEVEAFAVALRKALKFF